MKRIIYFVLIMVLCFSAAGAEKALNEYSYAELTALYMDVQREIMARPEWKEALVPPGVWVIGADIPSGNYSMKIHNDETMATVILYPSLNEYNEQNDWLFYTFIWSELPSVGKIILSDGNILQITDSLILSPASGLGF